METSGARACLLPPKHPDQGLAPSGSVTRDEERTVILRHPRYPDSSNILLVLSALDPIPRPDRPFTEDDPLLFGLHHDTARVACAIIADCCWHGYLSESKVDGAPPVTNDPDHILPGRNYYFHVPSNDDEQGVPYPIVPSFAHFQFPHNNLPPTWMVSRLSFPTSRNNPPRKSSFDNTVLTRDGSCRLTASTIGAEIAHFIPRTEDAWFAANQMLQYSSQPQAVVTNKTNNPCNAMLMGAQLHSVYDQRQFVIIPKWGAWLVHVLSGPHSEELAAVYHNIEPQPLSGLAVEYLFARFAWTVLAQTCFLEAGVPRRLVVRGKDGQPTAREVSGTECRIMFTPSLSRSKSRSQSPKKRVRDDTAEDEDKYRRVTDYDDAVWDARGRPRKRSAYQSATTSATSSFEYWRDASDCDIEAECA
ncbi:uncharacterized protein BBA_01736 [Beauveria bassiana ARSEF 2860]|uniref:Uncharacterized protein n=1 Tax=Beauveria bassiana (strain ARSEF 2860) TaxID=655819 RepID=J5K6S2_BEAB2|nr:uncharacterized protein BBA_01736 [Beauveria bassiana ARSEF 2860]EJP69771.1 hypothetical protein BBA_01736 [Beauveria bassiana ARSEF 2860]